MRSGRRYANSLGWGSFTFTTSCWAHASAAVETISAPAADELRVVQRRAETGSLLDEHLDPVPFELPDAVGRHGHPTLRGLDLLRYPHRQHGSILSCHAAQRRRRYALHASSSTERRVASMNEISSGPAMSGGATTIIGSARSSARQIRPASNSFGDSTPRSSQSHSSASKVARVAWSRTSSMAQK